MEIYIKVWDKNGREIHDGDVVSSTDGSLQGIVHQDSLDEEPTVWFFRSNLINTWWGRILEALLGVPREYPVRTTDFSKLEIITKAGRLR